MALTWMDLRDKVRASDSHEPALTRNLLEAQALVDAYVGSATVPPVILDMCYLEVGAEIWDRSNSAPAPVSQYAEPTTPLRVTRDPLNPVIRILKRWVWTSNV